MLLYRIVFAKDFSIEELEQIQEKINTHLSQFGVGLQDHNLTHYETDKDLAKEDPEAPLFIKPGSKFNYLSGLVTVETDRDKDEVLRLIRREVIKYNNEELKLGIDKIQAQDGYMAAEENWVDIPG